MWSTPSLPLLPGPLWPGVVAPVRVPSMGWIDQNIWVHEKIFKFIKNIFELLKKKKSEKKKHKYPKKNINTQKDE